MVLPVRRLAVIALVLSAAALLGCQPARLRAPVYGTGVPTPVERNFPDPALLRVGGTTFAFSTNSTGGYGQNIGVLRSDDLYRWVSPYSGAPHSSDALPKPPRWTRPLRTGGAFWAPSISKLKGRYVLHFAARHRRVSAGRPGWCIGTATSARAKGPYRSIHKPLFCWPRGSGPTATVYRSPRQDKGAIDPQVYKAPNGKVFLHFKAIDNRMELWGVRLTADGKRTRGRAHGLVSSPSPAGSAWEYSVRQGFTILENPAMDRNAQAAGTGLPYYLYYSGGDFTTGGYGTGVAACRRPLGPCVRATGKPWMRSRGNVRGPGGLSLFKRGRATWVAYHSWARGSVGRNGRRLHIEPLKYRGLTPVLRNRRPRGSFTIVAGPSEVELAGVARDPDAGGPVRVVVREDGRVIARRLTQPNGRWAITRPTSVGPHKYCVRLKDDNGHRDRLLRCRKVVVGTPAPSSATTTTTSIPAPTQPPSTTAPPPTVPPPTSPPRTTLPPTTTSLPPTTSSPPPSAP